MTTDQLGAGPAEATVIGSPEDLERRRGSGYRWIALSNTTLGVLMVTINASILLIALPDIFRGIQLDPLLPGNIGYLLWLIMGFLVVTAVLVVSFGRVGDMYGRVRMYNLGFAVFTVFSILLSVTWMHGSSGAMWLIVMRVLQGIGGALLFANSSAILTDAFPTHQRGLALGVNSVAALAGSFLGLLIGGLLAPVNWRLVFLVSVPFGLFGTVWAYLKLQDTGERRRERIDWWGNVTFAVGLIAVLAGITYGIQPYGDHTMGWTNPYVVAAIVGGIAVLGAFVVIETRVAEPMFRLQLFRIRAFSAGNAASLLSALGRGGLLLVLVLWLQVLWLPLHGHSAESIPVLTALGVLPLAIGYAASAAISGYLSDHFGARPFATGGMLVTALSFVFLLLLPVNFNYWSFAAILLLNGIGMGLFASPNRAGIMNSLPARMRGVGGGMAATFQNSAQVLSIGIFFSLIILGLASTLSGTLVGGLTGAGVPVADAQRAAGLPPVATLFASLLGYNPIQELLGPAAANLDPQQLEYVTGRQFFPNLISEPFQDGLHVAFVFAIVACLIAAASSYLRGGKYHYAEGAELGAVAVATAGTGTLPRRTSGRPTATPDREADRHETSPEQLSMPPTDAAVPNVAVPREAEPADATGPQLVGTVRAEDGRPVPGAVLTLAAPGEDELARTTTDDQGRFSFAPGAGIPSDVDPAREYVLVLSGRTVDPVARVVRLDGRVGPLDLRASSSLGSIEGRLVRSDATSEPVAGGTVVLTSQGAVVARIHSDNDGRFVLDGVRAGEHVLTAVAPDGQPRTALLRVRPHERIRRDVAVPTAGPASGNGDGYPAGVSTRSGRTRRVT